MIPRRFRLMSDEEWDAFGDLPSPAEIIVMVFGISLVILLICLGVLIHRALF